MVYHNKVAKDANKCIRSITKRVNKKSSHATTLDDALKSAHSEGLGEISQILTNYPHKILPCLKLVHSESFGVAKPSGNERLSSSEPWPDSYHLFRPIPKYWLRAWVQSVQPQFTVPVLELIEAKDRGAIRKIIEFCTGRKENSKVPSSCLDKLVMSRAFHKAYEEMGSRLNDSCSDEAIDSAGHIDWQGHGVYSFKVHEGKVNIVKHIMGYEVIIHRKFTPNLPQIA